MDLLLPKLSTATPEAQAAWIGRVHGRGEPVPSAMTVRKPVTASHACGSTERRRTGAAVARHTKALSAAFGALDTYFEELIPVLDTIAAQAAGASIDEGFWRSIYSYNGGSGRNTITGWSTAFLAYLVDQPTGHRVSYRPKRPDEGGWQRDHPGIDHFAIPSHVSSVGFT